MTKEEFLKRCEVVYDKGFTKDRKLTNLLTQWLDFVLRFEHTFFSHGQGQGSYVWDFMEMERERTGRGERTLANDRDGYALIEIAAILDHPCQLCAENPEAWHTRYGFCGHKEPNGQ